MAEPRPSHTTSNLSPVALVLVPRLRLTHGHSSQPPGHRGEAPQSQRPPGSKSRSLRATISDLLKPTSCQVKQACVPCPAIPTSALLCHRLFRLFDSSHPNVRFTSKSLRLAPHCDSSFPPDHSSPLHTHFISTDRAHSLTSIMSYYDDDRSRRQTSKRDDYEETSYKSSRGGGGRQTSLVHRNDSDSADEEVTRDFPPGGGYYRETTIRKSGRGPAASRRYSDDPRDDYTDSRRSVEYESSKRISRQHDDRRSKLLQMHSQTRA